MFCRPLGESSFSPSIKDNREINTEIRFGSFSPINIKVQPSKRKCVTKMVKVPSSAWYFPHLEPEGDYFQMYVRGRKAYKLRPLEYPDYSKTPIIPTGWGDDEDEDPSHGYVCMATGRQLHYRVLNSGDSVLASISPADIIPGDPWRTANILLGLGKSDGENSKIGWT